MQRAGFSFGCQNRKYDCHFSHLSKCSCTPYMLCSIISRIHTVAVRSFSSSSYFSVQSICTFVCDVDGLVNRQKCVFPLSCTAHSGACTTIDLFFICNFRSMKLKQSRKEFDSSSRICTLRTQTQNTETEGLSKKSLIIFR